MSSAEQSTAEPLGDSRSGVSAASRAGIPPGKLLSGVFVLVCAIFVLLPLLDLSEISNVGEGREGTVIQEIIDSGKILLPLRNGTIVPSKPILFHWIGAAISRLSGTVDLVTIRLPSAMAGIGTALLVWLVAAGYGGILSGVVAALLLLSTEGFVAVSTEGRVDSVFTFFVTLAVCAWLRGAQRNGTRPLKEISALTYHLTGIACGLAVLTKGPVGFVFVALIIGAIAITEYGVKDLRFLARAGWTWAAAIPLPWYIAASFLGKDNFIGRHLFYENLRRWTGGEGISPHSTLYYIPQLFIFCAPWSIPFLALLAGFLKPEGRAVWSNKDAPLSKGIRAGAIWFLVPLLFLTISSGKHNAYLAPLLPGLCLAAGLWITRVAAWRSTPAPLDRALAIAAVAVVGIGPLIVALAPILGLFGGNLGLSARNLYTALAPRWFGAFVCYAALSAGVIYAVRSRMKRSNFFTQWGAAALLSTLLITALYMPAGRAVRGITHGDRRAAEAILAAVPATEELRWILPLGADERLGVGRDDSFDALFFYLRRHVRMLNSTQTWEEPGLYVARREWIESRPPEYRARVKERLETGKLDDTPDEKLVLFELSPAESQNP